jgi:hypothetical protein
MSMGSITAGGSDQVGPGSPLLVERSSPPFRIYLDKNNGSDNNLGDSPGHAVSTVNKAVSLLQRAQKGGEIEVLGVSPGPLNIPSPLVIVQPIFIKALAPQAVSLFRTFDTPNSRSVWDAITTAAGTSLQSATAGFSAGDIGRLAVIYGAGPGGGTYFGFITAAPDATHATIPATAVARNSTTDPIGVKASILGDFNRVVTDAGMVAGSSVISSPVAAWTNADIGTEVVIAGAGQGGQALRGAILSISGNNATITAVAANTVSNQRCAIGVNFGNLLTYHVGGCGIRHATITDESIGATRIGSPLAFVSDDLGAGSQNATGEHAFEHVTLTSKDPSGIWEHMIDCDGSWNQKGVWAGN